MLPGPEPETMLREAMRLPGGTHPRDVLSLCKLRVDELAHPGDASKSRGEAVLQGVQASLASLVPENEETATPLSRASPHMTRCAVSLLRLVPSVLARATGCPIQEIGAMLDDIEVLMRRVTAHCAEVLRTRQLLDGKLRRLAERTQEVAADHPITASIPTATPRHPTSDRTGDAQWSYRRRLRTDFDAGVGSEVYVQQDMCVKGLRARAAQLEPLFEESVECLQEVDRLEALVPEMRSDIAELQEESTKRIAAQQAAMQKLNAACAHDHGVLFATVNRAETVVKEQHTRYLEWYKECQEWLHYNHAMQEEKATELEELPGRFITEKERLEAQLAQLRKDRDAEIERALRHSQQFLSENDAQQKDTEERLNSLLKSQEEERLRLQAELDTLMAERGEKQKEVEQEAVQRKQRFEKLKLLLDEIRASAFQRCDSLEHTQRCGSIACSLGTFVREMMQTFQRAGEQDGMDAGAEVTAWRRRVRERSLSAGTLLLLGHARAMHLRELQCADLAKASASTADRIDFCLETADPGVTVHHTWLEAVKARMVAAGEDSEALAASVQKLMWRLRDSEDWLRAHGVAFKSAADQLRDAATEWDTAERRPRRTSEYAAEPDLTSPRRAGDPRQKLLPQGQKNLRAGGRGIVVPEMSAADVEQPSSEYCSELIASASSPYASPLKPARMHRPTPPRRRVMQLLSTAAE